MPKKYSASLTGEPFLHYELVQIAKLKFKGLSDTEIAQKISAENIFKYKTNKRVSRRIAAVLRRLSCLDHTLIKLLIDGRYETSRIVTFYSILKTNKLVHDFLSEVVKENYILHKTLSFTTFDIFLQSKEEQNPEISSWSESTKKKVRQVVFRILAEAGFIKSSKGMSIVKPLISPELVAHLSSRGDIEILKALMLE